MIGGLQGEFGDLDIKYLKQNIPKYRKMSAHGISDMKCPAPPGYPDQLHPNSPSGKAAQCYPTSQEEAHDIREHYTRTIAYPIRICCPDGKH